MTRQDPVDTTVNKRENGILRAGHALFLGFALALSRSRWKPSRLRFYALFGPKILRFCLRAPAPLVFRAYTFALPVSSALIRQYIYIEQGQEIQDRTCRQNRTGRTGQGRTGQAEQDRQDETDRTG
jgi:hypothetical protein